MTYLPLARKYRPKSFEELIGQPHVTKTLTQALEAKRIAQAYLFTGTRGVGKTSAARILAKCLDCEKGPTARPCHTCSSCTQITQGNSLDVIEIDGASNRGIDEIRSLRDTVPYAPTSGPYRVYIIDEVHMLTTEAFNALLKTLEEPPAHVKFIFATTAPNKVPSTILSRCQRFDFRRLESATVVQTLTKVAKAEKISIDEPALYAIARAADGSLRDAEVILEQLSSFVNGAITEPAVTELLGVIELDTLGAWTQAIVDHQSTQALSILVKQVEQGKDALQLLTGLMHHVRNLLIIRSTEEAQARAALLAKLVDEPTERLAMLEKQAMQVSAQEWLLMLQLLSGAYELVRRSPMAQTILELAIIKLCTREAWQSLSEISQRLERLGASAAPAASTLTDARPLPAESVPAPVESESIPMSSIMVPEAVTQTWQLFLERLGQQKMSLAAYLMEAKPMQLEGTTLTIGLPAFALHQEVVTGAENRRLIERLLSELRGEPTTIQYTTLPLSAPSQSGSEAPGAVPSSAPPIVQDIVNLFNATVLDQPRPL